MKKLLVLIFAVAFLASVTAMAAEEVAKPFYMPAGTEDGGDYPNIKFGSQAFMGYTFTRTGGANANAFNVNRVLFTAYGDLSEDFFYGMAIDVAPFFDLLQSGNNPALAPAAPVNPASVHLNNAYLGYKFAGHKIMLGVIDTAFEGYILYNVWHHRRVAVSPYVGTGYSQNNRWDLGIALEGNFLEDVLQVFVGIYNGESYLDVSEFDARKNFQVRVTVDPFEKMLVLSTGIEFEQVAANGGNQYVIPVILHADLLDGMLKPGLIFTYASISGVKAAMLSFMANVYLMDKKVNPFVRFDYGLKNDGATGVTLAKKDMNIFAGLGYHFNPYVVVDLAFIWNRVDATSTNTYTFGPFAEVRF